jgi:undecaprenyl-diphosphatase
MDFLYSLDLSAFYAVNHLPHSPLADNIALVLHHATYGGIIYYPFLIFFALRKSIRSRLLALLGAISGIVTYILTDLIVKNTFDRLRPYQALSDAVFVSPGPVSYAFASGQTATAFAAATMIALMYPEYRKTKWGLFLYALVVAFDRVYMGHHYPSDVIGGALIGAGIAYLTWTIWRGLDAKRKRVH